MGCANQKQVKENIIIQISYCGGCGWTIPAKNLCDAIKKRLPTAVIDCRPQSQYTGVLKANLLTNKTQKKQIYKGNKQQINSSIQKIAQNITKAYKDS